MKFTHHFLKLSSFNVKLSRKNVKLSHHSMELLSYLVKLSRYKVIVNPVLFSRMAALRVHANLLCSYCAAI